MIIKKDFKINQKVWCILDLNDAFWAEGIIVSEKKISEKGIQFFKVKFNNGNIENIICHKVFPTKEELQDYLNDLQFGKFLIKGGG
jgi:hypothetical protein